MHTRMRHKIAFTNLMSSTFHSPTPPSLRNVQANPLSRSMLSAVTLFNLVHCPIHSQEPPCLSPTASSSTFPPLNLQINTASCFLLGLFCPSLWQYLGRAGRYIKQISAEQGDTLRNIIKKICPCSIKKPCPCSLCPSP